MAFVQEAERKNRAWAYDPAEREANRLSEGISASSPQGVISEMGDRLGADFSGVRFHTGASAAKQADAEDARAYTSGSDIYFGEGGFSPDIAAHELVHTVQQGAASGNVSESAPYGTVQRVPGNQPGQQIPNAGINGFEVMDHPQQNANQAPEPALGLQGKQEKGELVSQLVTVLTTGKGKSVYSGIEQSLKNLAKKSGLLETGKMKPLPLIRLLERAVRGNLFQYQSLQILAEAKHENSRGDRNAVRNRIREYKELIDNIIEWTPKTTLEAAAIELGMQSGSRVANVNAKAGAPATQQIINMAYTESGYKVFKEIEQSLMQLADKAGVKKSGRMMVKEMAIFLDKLAHMDAASRLNLDLLVQEPCGTEEEVRERTADYKALIETIKSNVDKTGLQAAAMESGLLKLDQRTVDRANAASQTQPKQIYEMTEEDRKKNHFNPGNVREVAEIQWKIDHAKTPMEAWGLFAVFSGNNNSQMLKITGKDAHGNDTYAPGWDVGIVDLKLFKNKLKNMARMVYDYPALAGRIGDLMEIEPNSGTNMYATRDARKQKSDIGYNAGRDRRGPDADRERANDWANNDGWSIAEPEFTGNHELGHVLNNVLVDYDMNDLDYRITADQMIKDVLNNNRKLFKASKIKTFTDQADRMNKPQWLMDELGLDPGDSLPSSRWHKPGQINMGASGFSGKLTSEYGTTNAAEFFAEAFKDVYAHGNKAKPMSIAFVKYANQKLRAKNANYVR